MPQFFYFIPGKNHLTLADIHAAGLAYAIPAPPFTQRQCTGPDAQPGAVFTLGDNPAVAYHPQTQTWTKSVIGNFHVGYETDAPPSPEDLARPDMIDHYSAILGDGKRWQLPTAVFHDGTSPLPKVRELQPDGSIHRRPAKQYEQLFLDGDKISSVFRNSEDLTDREEWDICIRALATNYRLSHDEANLLGALEDRATPAILAALIARDEWPDTEEK